MLSRSISSLTELVGGVLEGDGDRVVRGVADLKNATAEQLSFLANTKYLPQARITKAGVIVVSKDISGPFPCSVIRVESPSLAFSTIARLFAPKPIEFAAGIHPTAVFSATAQIGVGVSIQPHVVIEPGAKIGAGSIIGAGSYIGHDAVIGEKCLIYPRVVIRERCIIGSRVTLHSGVVIGSDGFGYEFQNGCHVKVPQTGFVQVDSDVEIGANTTVDRGRFDRTWIQEGAKIDNLVMIAHNVVIGRHAVVVAQCGISGSSSVGNYATLAGQVGLVGHIHVGDRSTVTAQSGVSKDVPAGEVVAGHHATPLKESLKIEAASRRLPEVLERLRHLEGRVKELSSRGIAP